MNAPSQMAAATPALRSAPPLPPAAFERIRRRMVLEGCKWDPQIGDEATLAGHALLLGRSSFAALAGLASALARETLAAEEELAERPELHALVGVPRPLRRCWARCPPPRPPRAQRLMRFDFHPTSEGWRVSEVNSDVPGGFAEASLLPALYQPHHPGTSLPPDPARAWVERIAADARRPCVALVAAPGFLEDQQVIAFLADAFQRRGCVPVPARLEDVSFRDGAALLRQGSAVHEAGAILRFLQAEWLLARPRPAGWRHYFLPGPTPVFNAGTAILTESKRFPLAWPHLHAPTDTWRALAPESREPTALGEGWLLKGAFSNNGDAVVNPGDERRWRAAVREARWHPERWVAQRRFDAVAIETPAGPRFPCLGLYTLGEELVGVYGRLSAGATVNHRAADVAVLIEEGR